jgi:hypothetical protein
VLDEERRFPGNLGSPTVAVVGCRADVFPTTVSAESFEETDTARNPAFERRHGHKELCCDRMGATELVGDVGVSS